MNQEIRDLIERGTRLSQIIVEIEEEIGLINERIEEIRVACPHENLSSAEIEELSKVGEKSRRLFEIHECLECSKVILKPV